MPGTDTWKSGWGHKHNLCCAVTAPLSRWRRRWDIILFSSQGTIILHLSPFLLRVEEAWPVCRITTQRNNGGAYSCTVDRDTAHFRGDGGRHGFSSCVQTNVPARCCKSTLAPVETVVRSSTEQFYDQKENEAKVHLAEIKAFK